jgi:inhibitor of cysteine peptidase
MNHLIFVAIPLLFLGIFNSAGKNVIVTKTQNQGKIRVLKNSDFQVLLDSNPTTGFTWQIVSFDSAVIQIKKEEFLIADDNRDNRVGAPGKQIFKFRTIASGTTDLQMVYQRSWEKATPSADRFRIQIIVPK